MQRTHNILCAQATCHCGHSCTLCCGSRQVQGGSSGFPASVVQLLSPPRRCSLPAPTSLNHLEAVPASPCSDERLAYVWASSVPGRQWAKRSPAGGGAGDTDGPMGPKQKAAVLPLLLLLSIPCDFLDPSTTFLRYSNYSYLNCIVCFPRVPCFCDRGSAKLDPRLLHFLCDFRL